MTLRFSSVSGPREKGKCFLTFWPLQEELAPWWLISSERDGSPWTMRADYQQAGAVFSNTCLTGPFIKHAKTTHNTDQNEKSVFTGQTAKLVYAERLWGESAVLQTWWDGIKWKIIAISSEPRITLREKKKLSQQGRSWNAAYLLIHSVELSD